MNLLFAREDVESAGLAEKLEINHRQRIILVSPFQLFNHSFRTKLQQIDSNFDLEVVFGSINPNPPYFDVNERESSRQDYPAVIVDLRRLAVKVGNEIHLKPFSGYYEWFNRNIAKNTEIGTKYLFPKPGSILQNKIGEYKVNSIFNPSSKRIMDKLSHRLHQDIGKMTGKSRFGEYNLFSEIKI